MNMKIWKIISSFIILILSSLIHFVYDIFPNNLTALFFNVNESIWEHNKMITLAFFIFMIIEVIKFKKSNKNVIFNNIISCLSCILFVLLIFTPIYFYILKKKESFIITIIIYYIAILFSQFISYKLYEFNYNYKLNYISIILWLILFITNAYLTFKPLKLPIFYDYSKNGYGIISVQVSSKFTNTIII